MTTTSKHSAILNHNFKKQSKCIIYFTCVDFITEILKILKFRGWYLNNCYLKKIKIHLQLILDRQQVWDLLLRDICNIWLWSAIEMLVVKSTFLQTLVQCLRLPKSLPKVSARFYRLCCSHVIVDRSQSLHVGDTNLCEIGRWHFLRDDDTRDTLESAAGGWLPF